MTASSDSNTTARPRAEPRGFPGRLLALLAVFLAGAAGSVGGLAHLRGRLTFESFRVEDSPVERVRPTGREPAVHFLLLHGAGANRRHLLPLAEVLAAAGGDVFLMDLPGRGDHAGRATPRPSGSFTAAMPTPRETRAALAVARHLQSQFGVRPERLVVVGHSLGGGVALEVARAANAAAVVSLAGLERRVAPGNPPNPFFITARLEIPDLRRAADRMHARARAARVARLEFLATHSSLPSHSSVQRAIVNWTTRAVPGAGLNLPPRFNTWLLGLEVAGLFFLAGLFVPLAGLAGWALNPEPLGEVVAETRFTPWSPLHIFGYALLAGGAGVSVLHLLKFFGVAYPLGFLRLEGGSYLASLLLLSTLWLLPALLGRPWVRDWREVGAKMGGAAALAAFVIVVGGGLVTWQLFDLWPTLGRFGKMLLLVPLLYLYALGEELLGRTYAKGPRAPSAFDAFLAWRLALFAGIVYAAFFLGSGEPMLVVLGVPLLGLSLVEYFFSAALYRALWSAYANGALKALLLAWILATLFPLQ